MRQFKYGELIETTMGNAIFVEYSNNNTTYRVQFTDGDNVGAALSLGERAILSKGKDTKPPKEFNSKYAMCFVALSNLSSKLSL